MTMTPTAEQTEALEKSREFIKDMPESLKADIRLRYALGLLAGQRPSEAAKATAESLRGYVREEIGAAQAEVAYAGAISLCAVDTVDALATLPANAL